MSLTVGVATANILRDLRWGNARKSLELVLAHSPDIVLLQEWGLVRVPVLRKLGTVELVPGPSLAGDGAYIWSAAAVGGCVVGARADRFTLKESRLVQMALPERAERRQRPFGVEPPRFAVAASYTSRDDATTIGVLGYHLTPGAQNLAGDYRPERPLLGARHRREVSRLDQFAAAMRGSHDVVFAGGDSNFHGLRIDGLISAWRGREDEPGTLGVHGRKVDDIHSTVPARTVRQIVTLSDHRAVLAEYDLTQND